MAINNIEFSRKLMNEGPPRAKFNFFLMQKKNVFKLINF